MNSATTLILGGGFGGIAAAQSLRSLLPEEHKIILIDKSNHFIVGATKIWVMLGLKTIEEITAERKKLLPKNVEFVEADIHKINTVNGTVETGRGTFTGDQMIIALGADLDMNAIPGLEKAAYSFYSVGDAARLHSELQEFSEGEIIILIPRLPIKCPPAPYEAALMLDDYFSMRGVRDRVSISICTTEPGPMSTAGPEMSNEIRTMIEDRDIGYYPLKQTVSIDDKQKRIRFNDGSDKRYDLLIAIPPHKVPNVIVEAGICNADGWIPVDPKTMKVKSDITGVSLYAVGDNTVIPLPGRYKPDKPLVLPKAGVFAASQGIIGANHIASEIRGEKTSVEFDGKGFCYLETKPGMALKGEGYFFAMPHPNMERRTPDEAQYRDKLEWIEDWLQRKIS